MIQPALRSTKEINIVSRNTIVKNNREETLTSLDMSQ